MVIYGVLSFFLIWLIFLSLIVYRMRDHYYNLVDTTKKKRIDEILDTLIKNDKDQKLTMEKIQKNIYKTQQESMGYIQKIGLVRFNPFKQIGGEQSFVISLLDKTDTGIIINFMYTREGIRVYSKTVKKGKGERYGLSEEETLAIKNSC